MSVETMLALNLKTCEFDKTCGLLLNFDHLQLLVELLEPQNMTSIRQNVAIHKYFNDLGVISATCGKARQWFFNFIQFASDPIFSCKSRRDDAEFNTEIEQKRAAAIAHLLATKVELMRLIAQNIAVNQRGMPERFDLTGIPDDPLVLRGTLQLISSYLIPEKAHVIFQNKRLENFIVLLVEMNDHFTAFQQSFNSFMKSYSAAEIDPNSDNLAALESHEHSLSLLEYARAVFDSIVKNNYQ